MSTHFDISVVRQRADLPAWCPPATIAARLTAWLTPWGDPLEQIQGAIDYALSSNEGRGGFLLLAREAEEVVGLLIMLDTGMGGYIPRHHLVYVAVDPKYRGRGLGAHLVKDGISTAGTQVSLHVDTDNPAVHLYERLGFAVQYLEMRTGLPEA